MKKAFTIKTVLLTILTLTFLAFYFFRASQFICIDYNEGWNAGFSQFVTQEKGLYTSFDSTVMNNYPPLSFYMVAGLSNFFENHIFIGRHLSLLGLLITSISIGIVLSRHDRVIGIITALLFILFQCTWHMDYVGMNDPQWLGHGIMSLGLILFWLKRDSRFALISVLILWIIAGMIKHSLISLPISATIYLGITKHKHFRFWLISAFIFSVSLLIFLKSSFDGLLWDNIFHAPRVVNPALIARSGEWLLPSILPFAVLLISSNISILKKSLFPLIFAAVAFLFGMLSSSGGGVYYNLFFDFEIALFLLLGAALVHTSKEVQLKGVLALTLPILLLFPMKFFTMKESVKKSSECNRLIQSDIRYLSQFNTPVMCENLALQYWAGKSYSFDLFTMDQKVKSGFWNDEVFIGKLQDTPPSVIQLESIDDDNFRLTEGVREWILAHYKVDRKSAMGYYLIPRI